MQRQSKTYKKVDAILTADWHLREDQPICRTDNFEETQWNKVQFVKELQQKHDCPVLHAGDFFNHWKPSPYLLSKTIEFLPNLFSTCWGNHDLPQRNIDLDYKSGIWTLQMAKLLDTYGLNNFFEIVDFGERPRNLKKALLWHVMTYQDKKPFPDCTSPKANKILRKYPQYDLIVTGDNHQPFVEEYEGRLLVNPGSLTRQRASETHLPRVYLWYAKDNTVEAVYLPCKKDVITREHIEVVKKRNERIEAFVGRLNNDYETTVSFEDNLKQFEQTNKVHQSIMNVVYKSIEQ